MHHGNSSLKVDETKAPLMLVFALKRTWMRDDMWEFESPILRREKAPSYLVFRTTGVDHRASMCSAICAQLRIL